MKQQKKLSEIFSWILLATMVLPRQALAEEAPRVVISEVNWGGSVTSNADEWLELQNLWEEAIDLSSWSIEGAGASGGTIILPEGAVIEPYGTYLISNYASSDSTLAVAPNYVTTNVSLSNSALRLVLRAGNGEVVDEAGDGGRPMAGSSPGSGDSGTGGASMIRTSDGWETAATSIGFDDGVEQLGTPGVGDLPVTRTIVEPEPEVVTEETPATEEVTLSDDLDTAEELSLIEDEVPDAEEPIAEETSADEETPESVDEPEVLTPASYTRGTLIINEVFPAPTEGNEWVEIYNPFNNVIPLEGWQLIEGGGTKVTLRGYLGFGQFTTFEFVSRLNNSGDTVRLVDPTGATIDTLTYGKEVKSGMSAARDDEGRVVATLTPTRYSANVITVEVVEVKEEAAKEVKVEKKATSEEVLETAKSGPTTLWIISLLPNPNGADEELEEIIIENFGDDPVPLADWILTDSATAYKLVGELGPGLKLILPRPTTRIALNNTSDTLSLNAPSGEVIDTITYEDPSEDAHYARSDEGWTWTGIPTPAEPEDVSDPACEGTAPEGARANSITTTPTTRTKKSSQATAVFEGVVIAPPGIFGTQVMYGDGLQLYQYNGDFPILSVGDVVRARGTPSTNHGEGRLKLSSADDLTVIGHEEVEATEQTLNDLTAFVGRLIVVEGMIVGRASDRFTIEQDGAELVVIAKESTEISLNGLTIGQAVRITGVLSSYDGKLRLLPRFQTDVVNTVEQEATTTSAGTIEEPTTPASPLRPIGIGLVGSTTLALAWRWIAFHRKQRIAKLVPQPNIA